MSNNTKNLNSTNIDSKSLGSKDTILGIWYAIAAFAAWGVLPLYWKSLQQIPAGEILAHRVLWSFVLVFAILIATGGWAELKEKLTGSNKLAVVFLGALLISLNWFIYIWAVNTNQVVEASLGYFINPLVNISLGVLVLRERLNFWQLVALVLAAIGVIILASQFGRVPWVALSLALTFGTYGLVKKLVNLSSLGGLALETAFIAPVALIYLIMLQVKGTGSMGTVSIQTTLLLICSGVITAVPLLWFASGAKRVSLSTVGFVQYLSPTISLFLGVFIFKEPFTKAHFISFGFIWSALVLYTFSSTNILQNLQPKLKDR